GERTAEIAHILEGVKAGDTVVTSGQVRLSNGAKVKVVESDAITPPSETPKL
ncbi:efflux transporter periplasmic adaptor subunit, partial [Vibrio breoganii]